MEAYGAMYPVRISAVMSFVFFPEKFKSLLSFK
jgi:hypothetical protein